MSDGAQLALIAMIGTALAALTAAFVTVAAIAAWREAKKSRELTEAGNVVADKTHDLVNSQKDALLAEIVALKKIIADGRSAHQQLSRGPVDTTQEDVR
jgi:hypothetical protein